LTPSLDSQIYSVLAKMIFSFKRLLSVYFTFLHVAWEMENVILPAVNAVRWLRALRLLGLGRRGAASLRSHHAQSWVPQMEERTCPRSWSRVRAEVGSGRLCVAADS